MFLFCSFRAFCAAEKNRMQNEKWNEYKHTEEANPRDRVEEFMAKSQEFIHIWSNFSNAEKVRARRELSVDCIIFCLFSLSLSLLHFSPSMLSFLLLLLLSVWFFFAAFIFFQPSRTILHFIRSLYESPLHIGFQRTPNPCLIVFLGTSFSLWKKIV